ncbi:MAG TPA: VCBS repeat-containing protein, partial [Planctomycetes bacterium]|nr:VCBS repeat-containing protein [Planctomycetota bacterium]
GALALEELNASEFEDVWAPAPLFRPVQPPGLAAGGNLALGIGELRERFDHRLGLPLLGSPSGVAVSDVNDDGYEDIYLCAPGGVPNRLLLGTEGGFVDASSESGVDLLDLSRGALFADFDRDGNEDLVVGIGTKLLLFTGDGGAHFSPGLAIDVEEATSITAADIDLDGDLDLYVCRYVSPYDEEGFPVPYHDANNGAPNLLLENRTETGGPLRFVDATAERGLDENNHRFSFAAAFEDFDLDGDSDLYVANDFGRNNLYRNDGGRFTDVAAEAGVEDVSAGMGVSTGDVDGDGLPDLLVANMQSNAGSRVTYQRRFRPGADAETLEAYRRHARGNSLFRNRGDGTFVDESLEAGITRGRWAWGARLVDLDGDGRLDAVTPNGFLTAGSKPDL